MSTEVRVPALPESVADATVLTWHCQPGEAINRDDNLVDLETDKVVLEVPAPVDGVLQEIRYQIGETVQADDLLALIEEGVGRAAAPAKPTPDEKREPEEPLAPAADPEKPALASADTSKPEPVLTPAVRRLVKELKLNPREIPGTGKDGRILKSDVMRYLDARESAEPHQDMDVMRTPVSETPATPAGTRPEQRVPMTRLRARIAERLMEAQHNAAILTTFNEVNLYRVMELRKQYNERFEKEHEIRLGFMSFFIKAVIEALKKFPVLNASVDGNDIDYHGYYDIGIAVGSPRGLVVPILRDADQLSFADTEKAVREFGRKAQEGALTYEELTGGTFTVSNGGVYGSMMSTPILNPPQSGILGMHSIQQRPVVENGEIVIRPMMYLALSYDHRIIDGREAVQSLVTIKETLEDPTRLLLQI